MYTITVSNVELLNRGRFLVGGDRSQVKVEFDVLIRFSCSHTQSAVLLCLKLLRDKVSATSHNKLNSLRAAFEREWSSTDVNLSQPEEGVAAYTDAEYQKISAAIKILIANKRISCVPRVGFSAF
ncbi:hypothetical protein Y032_0025g1279 [Ancylostoma ceylanicum]|uniref:Uncharacterized protein n=1 Tax=Ancylostoma ceylanicum TaxID=53326 RepID=A0A016UXR0_9BILA|nr:hypothetical protein Y032_0025g1279 [Ancylostoma ceylanicum]